MTRKIAKQVLLLTCMFFAITVTAQEKQKIYVWDFVGKDNISNIYAQEISENFEQEILRLKKYTVLQRREFAQLLEQNKNEKDIQGLNDVSDSSKVLLKAKQAQLVVFGKISQTGDGLYKISASIEDLNTSEIKNKYTEYYRLSELTDDIRRSKNIKDFVYKLENDESDIAKNSDNSQDLNAADPKENSIVPTSSITKKVEQSITDQQTDVISNPQSSIEGSNIVDTPISSELTPQIAVGDETKGDIKNEPEITENSIVQTVSVTYVEYPKGNSYGTFQQTGQLQWVEKNTDGVFSFNETARDEWSIYLSDPESNKNIRIDLYKKQIFFNEAPYYDISNYTVAPVNSLLSIGDDYGGGIILYIDNTGHNGLIAQKQDLGEYNDIDALNSCAALGNGWRLPTYDEINLLHLNKDIVGGFSSERYWFSSEDSNDPTDLHLFYIVEGVEGWAIAHEGEDITALVRAVRDF